MKKVTGIGSVFFRANNPEQLAAWYAEYLAVSPLQRDYDQQPWAPASLDLPEGTSAPA